MSHNDEIEVQFRGLFRARLFKADENGNEIPGTCRFDSGWFDNIITDQALDYIGVYPGQSHRGCQVGSGSTVPSASDTALVSYLGSTINRFSVTTGRDITDPANSYIWNRRVYRFVAGVATGNISELGVVFGSSDGTTDPTPGQSGGAMRASAFLFSRALMRDSGGTVTTITKLPDETLDVSYETRMYIPRVDITGTLTFDGVLTNYTLRPSEINVNTSVNTGGWNLPGDSFSGIDMRSRQSTGYGENRAWTGASSVIGTDTSMPTGNAAYCDGVDGINYHSTYVSGNKYLDHYHSWNLGVASTGINAAGGVGAARFVAVHWSMQVGFSPRIAKTSDKVMNYTMRVSWSRRP